VTAARRLLDYASGLFILAVMLALVTCWVVLDWVDKEIHA